MSSAARSTTLGHGIAARQQRLELARLDEHALGAGLLGAGVRGVGELVPREQDLGAGVAEVVARPRAP